MEITFPRPVCQAISMLQSRGFEGYAVGGCVRDSLLGKFPSDWDITTSALPRQTEEVFAGYPLIETGLKHGTVTVLIDQMPLEITTYRIDGSYSDSRRPDSVSFTASLKEDLRRRDFTINAMAAAPGTGIIDPFHGEKDLKEKIIRAVGDPAQRFSEDALRILRGMRFSAVLGFEIEKDTADAMAGCRDLLKKVSAERCFSELKKLLCGLGAEDVLLRFAPVMEVLLPELAPLRGFDQKTPYHIYDIYTHTVKSLAAIRPDPILRLTMLLHDIGKPACFTLDEKGQGHFKKHPAESARMAEEILKRLRCDRQTIKLVCALIQYHDVTIPANKTSLRRWINQLGEDVFLQLIEVKKADNLAQNLSFSDRQQEYETLLSLYRQIQEEQSCCHLSDLSVSGDDLKELGLFGKPLGEMLQKLLSAVIDERCPNDRQALLDLAKAELSKDFSEN